MTNQTWKNNNQDSARISAPKGKEGNSIEGLGGGGSALTIVVREDLSKEMTVELRPE